MNNEDAFQLFRQGLIDTEELFKRFNIDTLSKFARRHYDAITEVEESMLQEIREQNNLVECAHCEKLAPKTAELGDYCSEECGKAANEPTEEPE